MRPRGPTPVALPLELAGPARVPSSCDIRLAAERWTGAQGCGPEQGQEAVGCMQVGTKQADVWLRMD